MVQGGENGVGFGADAEVGVRFGVGDASAPGDDEGSGKRKAPAFMRGGVVAVAGVGDGDVDEDGAEVAAGGFGDGVGDAEAGGEIGVAVGEDGEGKRCGAAELVGGEAVLARRLRGDGGEEGTATTEFRVEVAPGFELGDAVRAPAAAEEGKDERAEGEEVGGVDEASGAGVGEGEGGRLGGDGEDAVLDAGVEEVGGGLLGEGEAIGLHEGSGALGDVVEFVLQAGHGASCTPPSPGAAADLWSLRDLLAVIFIVKRSGDRYAKLC